MDMEINKQIDNTQKRKSLKNKIIDEYLYIIKMILILFILLPFLFDFMNGDNSLGQALGAAIILRMLTYILTFVFMVINPIKILITYKNDIKEIFPKRKKLYLLLLLYFLFCFHS